jgi:hypothetical protein
MIVSIDVLSSSSIIGLRASEEKELDEPMRIARAMPGDQILELDPDLSQLQFALQKFKSREKYAEETIVMAIRDPANPGVICLTQKYLFVIEPATKAVFTVVPLKALTLISQLKPLPTAVEIAADRPKYALLIRCPEVDDGEHSGELTTAQKVATYLRSRNFALTIKENHN